MKMKCHKKMDSILKKIQNNNKLNLWLKLIRIKEKK